MSNAYVHNNPYITPYFKIYLEGQPLTDFENSLVEEVVYEDTSTGSDMVSITIHDPDYTIIGDKRIVKSTPCKVEGGWTNKYRTWIEGYVSAVDIDFPEEGVPTITLHIMDKTYVMNRLERKKTYKNMSYKEIVGKIASQYGMVVNADAAEVSTKKHESVTQSFETDIQFLSGLAQEIGFLLFYRSSDNSLNFKNKDSYFAQSPVATLWYRRFPFDILSFRPRIVQADQLDEIEESDIDDKDKKVTTATVKKATAAPRTNNTSGTGNSAVTLERT